MTAPAVLLNLIGAGLLLDIAALWLVMFNRRFRVMLDRAAHAAFLLLLTWAAFCLVMCVALIGWPS